MYLPLSQLFCLYYTPIAAELIGQDKKFVTKRGKRETFGTFIRRKDNRELIVEGLHMNYSTGMKWITGLAETFLAIPIIGGAFVLGTGYNALFIMFILHAITLLLSIREGQGKIAPILGLFTSVVSVIPVIGWFLHLVTAIALFISALTSNRYRI